MIIYGLAAHTAGHVITYSRRCTNWILTYTTALCALSNTGYTAPNRLISAARAAETPHWATAQARHEKRGRMAEFDPEQLGRISRALSSGGKNEPLELQLLDDVAVTVYPTQVEWYGAGRYVIRGRLKQGGGAGDGLALLSVVDGVLQAQVVTPDARKFSIASAGGKLCRVSEVDPQAHAASCANDGKAATDSQQASAATAEQAPTSSAAVIAPDGIDSSAAAGEGAVVDVMILYTQAFLNTMGSVAAVEARCQLAVDLANTMFADSQINPRVRFVNATLVNYVESGEPGIDLSRLMNPSDGFLDEVSALREQHQADVVHLFGDGRRLGMANLYPSDYFAVVQTGYPELFVHELGHNFGCQHDRPAAGNFGTTFAYGHVFPTDDGSKYGCVMSYAGNQGAKVIPLFSNPNIAYKGAPTGVPKGRSDSADNARMVNLTGPVLAAYRNGDGSSSRVPVSAKPPRASFPATPAGSTSAEQNITLSYIGFGRQRSIQISNFRVHGAAEAFSVQVYDPASGQFVSGDSFTVNPPGVTLVVRFTPSSDATAHANITFNVDDFGHRYSPPPIRLVGNATAPLLKNISTRVQVGHGENAMIGGFIVGGSAPREIIVRAIGPSLAARGVPGAMVDPVLELYRGSDLIAENDDWEPGVARESVQWTGVAPAMHLESAVVARLEPGSYTAVVRGYQNATGVGLIEAYDLDADDQTQFLNISTRGQVSVGEDVMIGGFILGGASPSRVLVRALGPSLARSGVEGSLGDPTLEVHDGQGARVDANDNWRSDNEAAITLTGAAPQDEREAAIVAVLQPGAYTAIVRGVNDTRGVGLVEVYKLQVE